jgi:hypothetical protein
MEAKVTDKSNRAIVFEMYDKGLSMHEVLRRTKLSFRYVELLFFKWEIAKARARIEIDAKPQASQLSYTYLYNRPKQVDFALCTNNKKVINAFKKLQSGWKH